MRRDYDTITAQHYAAYRPCLHLPILTKCLGDNANYNLGLDVGCGTGQSTLTLTQFSKKVIGIDPSLEMLQKATQHKQIEYLHCNGKELEFDDYSFDIITYAGSWYYGKSQKLLNETIRVCKPQGIIVVYDFEILFKPVLHELGATLPVPITTDYDYETYFSGLKTTPVSLQKTIKDKTHLEISSQNLAHILLSDKKDYKLLCKLWGETNVYDTVVSHLQKLVQGDMHHIDANIFYSRYLRM